ncbi:DNA ligase 1 [Gracilaria domingensis]|nr:DNA ligase 1 [Gracilaria domingensis]
MHETRGRKPTLAFWCTFSDEDTGGWVRADRMVLFHPSLLEHVRVRSNHQWHESQASAINAALKAYKTIHRGSQPPPKPRPPHDLTLKRHRQLDDLDLLSDEEDTDDNNRQPDAPRPDDDDPMDIGSDSESADGEDHHQRRRKSSSATRGRRPTTSAKSPRTPAAPKPQRKKRKSITPRTTPTPRKRAKTAEHELEDQLLKQSESKQIAALKSRIEEMQANLERLTASLRRKEKALSDLRSSGNVVTFAPVKQDTVPIETMPQPFTGSLLSSDEFEHRVTAMRQLFDKLDDAAKDVHDKRQQLSEEQEKIRQHYGSLLEGVSDAQGKVVTHQKELADLLRGILVNRVAVIDLRKHQAGNLIKTMSKRYKDMHNVSAYCNALYRGWKRQVVDYVHNNPSVKDEEKKKDKSSHTEGKENGAVGTPSASQEDSPKKDGATRRSKGSNSIGAAEKAGENVKEGKGSRHADSSSKSKPKADEKTDVDSTPKKESTGKDGAVKQAGKHAKEEQASGVSKMDVDGGGKEKESQGSKEEQKEGSTRKGPQSAKIALKQPIVGKKKSEKLPLPDKEAKKSEEKEGSSGKQGEGKGMKKPASKAKEGKEEGKVGKTEGADREGDTKGAQGGGAVKEVEKTAVESKGDGIGKAAGKAEKKDDAKAAMEAKKNTSQKEGDAKA